MNVDFGFNAGVGVRRSTAVTSGLPFWRSVELHGPDCDVFLLDSALSDGRLGRWSFAGGEPAARLSGRRVRRAEESPDPAPFDLELTIWREPDGSRPGGGRQMVWRGDPFAALRQLRELYGPADLKDNDPVPFGGGMVGWFGYGVAWAIERLPWEPERIETAAPDLLFLVVDDVLRHDHTAGTTTLMVAGRGPDREGAARDLESRTAAWQERLAAIATAPAAGALPPAPACPAAGLLDAPGPANVTPTFDETAYRRAVARCREHILAGDAFEICLTQQLTAPSPGDPWRLYQALREVNPAPFAAFVRAGGVAVVGASPERFLSLDRTGRLESRPIKGTRPRGATPDEDERLRHDLAAAAKDGAENVMIVDLVRSDLGRVARIGSVTVTELCAVESYATVHQLVSTVQAQLRTDRDALDAVRACFPGGSMTGAPKLEAMAIIAALEPAPRGVYAGALGWLGWDGAMDLSIVIRTFVCADGRVSFGVGGAVTADSEPEAEYRESMDKARALLAALRRVGADPTEGSRP